MSQYPLDSAGPPEEPATAPETETPDAESPEPEPAAPEAPVATPAAVTAAEFHGIDLTAVEPTGSAGQVTKSDVLSAADELAAARARVAELEAAQGAAAPASPSAPSDDAASLPAFEGGAPATDQHRFPSWIDQLRARVGDRAANA